MRRVNAFWGHTMRVAILTSMVSMTSWAEEAPGPPPAAPATPPPAVSEAAAPIPQFSIPAAMKDSAFSRFVDLTLLAEAYLDNDPGQMVDIGLQLVEGEKVLLRSHKGLKSSDVFDVALRLATERRDTATLDRLARVAEKHADKALSEKLELSRQLAAQPRAAIPPIPPQSEKLSSDQVHLLQERIRRLERARAVGDLSALRRLQAELKETKTSADALETYLEKQVAEAIAGLAGNEEDEVVRLLGDLSGASREITGIMLQKAINGGVLANAKPFRLDPVSKFIFIKVAGAAVGGGVNEWVPQASYYGLIGRYGTTYINLDWKKELQTDANGNVKYDSKNQPMPTGRWFQVYGPNPDYVLMATWNASKNDYDYTYIGMRDTFTRPFVNGPLTVSASAIIAAGTGYVNPARIVAAGGGNFMWKHLVEVGAGNITFASIVAAGGGNIWPNQQGIPADIYNRAGANPNGGATIANIVAAGGGNITPNSIVAAGGGNYTMKVVGNIKVTSASALEMWSDVAAKSLIQDGGAYLVGQDGASLIGKNGAAFGELISTYSVQSVSQSPYFKGAKKYTK